ncbi:hypothetical protein JXA88_14685 [Candidatus Fermentibacteria bacterium]|nr:hypothetical protein [Candidatus Fermentibacteria bacterium]
MRDLRTFLLCVVAVAVCCDENGGSSLLEPIDLLPADGEISGWQWDGIPAEATDGATLYDLIDGGAAEFTERGFVSGVLHHYRGTLSTTTSTLELFIADQGSSSNAKSIFDRRADRLPFAQEILIGAANEARIDEATGLDTVVLDFWHDRFYVQATLDNRQVAPDLARQTVVQFAENVSLTIYGG